MHALSVKIQFTCTGCETGQKGLSLYHVSLWEKNKDIYIKDC